MKRIQHDLVPGTPEWHAFRGEHDGASEIPSVLGLDEHVSRSERLREKSTGIAKEVDARTQAIFDNGHRTEALARTIAEKLIGEDLYPQVWSYGRLSASTDGMTMDGATIWQHKQWNIKLVSAVDIGILPDKPMAQVQQEMLVTGAKRCLFMVSDGTEENCESMWVLPDLEWVKRIQAGWTQFHADLANYTPTEVLPPVTAAPTLALPTLFIQARGEVTKTNMPEFKAQITEFLGTLNMTPATDQEFANGKDIAKKLRELAVKMKERKADMLAQTATIGEVAAEIDLLAETVNKNALALEKAVDREETARKLKLIMDGKARYEAHIESLKQETGGPWIVLSPPDFAGAIKGKSKIASMTNAIDTALANGKIEADASAKRIRANLVCLKDAGHEFLFNDRLALISKPLDDLKMLIKVRIAEHAAAEQKRLDAERERIRAEEQARIRQEELDRIERERIEAVQKAAAISGHVQSHETVPLVSSAAPSIAADVTGLTGQDNPPVGNVAATPIYEDACFPTIQARLDYLAQVAKTTVMRNALSAASSAITSLENRVPSATPIDPMLDREGLIRSFLLTRKEPIKKLNEMRATLVEFCKFVDTFKVGRKAA